MAKRKDRKVSAEHFKKKSVTEASMSANVNQSMVRPINPVIHFPNLGPAGGEGRNYDMRKHYDKGFDDIVNKAFYTVKTLLQNPKDGTENTKYSYLSIGFASFSQYLAIWNYSLGRELTVEDITPELLEGYRTHLRGSGIEYTTQKSNHALVKSLLTAMRKHSYWQVSKDDFDAVFPKNPYPNSNKRVKGQKPFSEHEKRQLVVALKQALKPIYLTDRTEPLTGYELTVCLLAVAMQTGINTTPLLNMTTNSLSDHPLKSNRKLLTVYKARGNATQLHNLRKSENIELAQGVKLDVAQIIDIIIKLNKPVRDRLSSISLLTYHTAKNRGHSDTTLSGNQIIKNTKKLIKAYDLKDEDRAIIKVNISRIRKTFINGIYELSGEDILIAAQSAKHKGTGSIDHYLEAPEKSKRNLALLGEIRVKDLTNDTQTTPLGRCKDPVNGDKAPKNGSICADFLGCFRCKSFVITGDDLYRLYSFYWAIVRNRDSFGRKDWKRHLRNVMSIIDEEVEPAFAERGMVGHLQAERERARTNPHPYWINLDMLRVGQ